MSDPSVSILMPVYNTENYLEQCLESILNQTFSDWELIAVDDFSTDESYDIISKYADNNPRIKLFKNHKKGIVPALELAFKNSRGTYIHRMDSDDVMPEKKLKALYQLLQANPGCVATGAVEYFSNEKEMERGFLDYADWLNSLLIDNSQWEDIYYECPVASPAWMLAKCELEKIGGITSGIYPEDYELIFRIYTHNLEVVSTSKVVHYWRDRKDRASRTQAVYQDQLFFPLKCKYFFKSDRKRNKRLVLWGAGRKGKQLHSELCKYETPFWIDKNKKRWGKHIQGNEIFPLESFNLTECQTLIAVSSPDAKKRIRKKLQSLGLVNNKDYFFMC